MYFNFIHEVKKMVHVTDDYFVDTKQLLSKTDKTYKTVLILRMKFSPWKLNLNQIKRSISIERSEKRHDKSSEDSSKVINLSTIQTNLCQMRENDSSNFDKCRSLFDLLKLITTRKIKNDSYNLYM
uniref:Uncharacterized protein n=1 Tax=Parastrongyloides trichosuri TaxID=131310 RepID=A0A0N4Z118_PARTI